MLFALAKPAFMIAADAPRRWVDACKVGDLLGYPSEDGEGLSIDEATIDAFVANFYRHDDCLPCDGAGISPVHGLVEDSGVDAVAWIHNVEKRLDGEEQAHLWFELELLPEVAERMDAGKLAYGSIAFELDDVDHVTGEPIGPDLHSYAITNKPFRPGLTPHSAAQASLAQLGTSGHTTVVLAAPMRIGAIEQSEVALGPAQELRQKVLEILRVDPAELEEPEGRWKVSDRVHAIFNAAELEDIVEGEPLSTQQTTTGDTMPGLSKNKGPRTRSRAALSRKALLGARMAALGLTSKQLDALLLRIGLKPGDYADDESKFAALLQGAQDVDPANGDDGQKPGATPPPAGGQQQPAGSAQPGAQMGDDDEPDAALADELTPEQAMAAIQPMLASLRTIFGNQTMTPDEAAAMLEANAELLATAVKSAGSGGGAVGKEEETMSDDKLAKMEARLTALETQNAQLSEELEAERTAGDEALAGELVDEALEVRGLSLDGEEGAKKRAKFVRIALAAKGKDGRLDEKLAREELDDIFGAVNRPPMGRRVALGSGGRSKGPAGRQAPAAIDMTQVRTLAAKLREEQPKLSPYEATKRAMAQVARDGHVEVA